MPTNRTTDQINAALDTLVIQMNQIYGTGLTAPQIGLLDQIQNRINGLQETVNQVVLTLDAQLNTIQTQLTAVTAMLNAQMGLPS